MNKDKIKVIEVDDSALNEQGQVAFLATICDASPTEVSFVLAQSPTEDDGRSDWCWIRLPNGDLILGVFPQGETYLLIADSPNFLI